MRMKHQSYTHPYWYASTRGPLDTGGSRISLKGGGTGKQCMIVCITKDWVKYSGIDL